MPRAGSLVFLLAILGATACQALWGMESFEGDGVSVSGGGFGGQGSGGAGQEPCRGKQDCAVDELCLEGKCTSDCEAGLGYCDGRTLYFCRDDGEGFADPHGEACATPELCDISRFGEACVAPRCDAGAYDCAPSSQGQLRARECPASRTEWKTIGYCDGSARQCSPDVRGCFALGMDQTEVTRGAYAEFLSSTAEYDVEDRLGMQPSACAWNTTFHPQVEGCLDSDDVCEGDDCDRHPQVCVDWCDAMAYCRAQGKTLCGTLGDQRNVTRDLQLASDPTFSSWANACLAGTGAQCDAVLQESTISVERSCPLEAQGYEGLRGLIGNVSEWEYACDRSADGEMDQGGRCLVRGGSFVDGVSDCLLAVPERRNKASPEIGFRCCLIDAAATSSFSGVAGGASD